MNIAVSACLLGRPCRFDGQARPCAAVQQLGGQHTLVPVCPESMGGLSIPRPPSEIAPNADAGNAPSPGASGMAVSGTSEQAASGAAGQTAPSASGQTASAASGQTAPGTSPHPADKRRRVVDATGADLTEAFYTGARRALERAQQCGCTLAVLKAKSPSCGSGAIFDGTFSGTLVEGWGIAAQMFREAGIRVVDERQVEDGTAL